MPVRKILSATFCMIGISMSYMFIFVVVTGMLTRLAMWIGIIIGAIGALLLEV